MAKLLTAAESPKVWASGGQAIEISEEISSFSKLEEALGQELGRIDPAQHPADWRRTAVSGRASFEFADAQFDEVVATVAVRTSVPLVCQRCLEVFAAPLEIDSKLQFVRDDATPVQSGCEAWELEEAVVRPLDLVDELLVMALPFAAMHDDVDCSGGVTLDAPVTEETVRPFADLRAQMEAASRPEDPAED